MSEMSETRETIDMSANENPFGPSPKALAAIEAVLPTLASYPDRNDANVCRALSTHHTSRCGVPIGADCFTTTNSGVDMLSLIERALFKEHNSVIVCPPAFYMYQHTSTQNRADIIEVPLCSDSFAVNVDAIVAAVRPDTRLVFLCNPDNPTGRLFDNTVLTELLDRLPAHVTLVYDEVYYHFADGDALPNVISHVLAQRNLVALHSFSKAYGLAGMRLGYVMGHPGLIEQIKSVKLPFQVGALGLAAMQGALIDDEHVEKTVNNNAQQRAWLRDALIAIGFVVPESQSNFLLIQCPVGLTPRRVVETLEDRGIKIRAAFGLTNHVRVTVSLQDHNQQFVHAMADLIATSRG